MTDKVLPQEIQAIYQKSHCLHTEEEIQLQIKHLAQQIHEKLSDQNPLLLCVMIGGVVLTGNLLPRLDFPLELDYIHATRYRGKTTGHDELHWKTEPSISLENRHVLIVEDILDQGLTLQAITDYCFKKGAKTVRTAVLLDKEECRIPGGLSKADFTGFVIPNHYVFGYGLDYKNYLRNAPGIFMVPPGT